MSNFFSNLLKKINPVKDFSIEDKLEFERFYVAICLRIKNHKTYETDFSDAQITNNKIIVEFKIEEYVNEIHEYFLLKDFYRHLNDTLFHKLIIGILVPQSDVADMVDAAVRKELFAGVLVNIAEQNKVRINHLIKFYYEFIVGQGNAVQGKQKEEVLEIFKSAVAKLPNSTSIENDGSSIAMDLYSKQGILNEIHDSLRINSRLTLRRFLSDSHIAIFLLRLIFVALGLFVLYIPNAAGFTALLENSGFPMSFDNIRLNMTVLLLIGTVISTAGFYLAIFKRRMYKSIIKSFRSRFNLTNEDLKSFYKSRYNYDVRK